MPLHSEMAAMLAEKTEQLAIQMLSEEAQRWKATIYKVPTFSREINHKAFTPEFVSFGPFHCGNTELTEGEGYKKKAFVNFINRATQPLQNIVHKLTEEFTYLKAQYFNPKYNSCSVADTDAEFLFMMLVDGCFMLEVLEYYAVGYLTNGNYPLTTIHEVYRKWWPYIRRDMLLIENQLPLFLLSALVRFQDHPQVEQDIDRYVNRLVLLFIAGEEYTTVTATLGLHALDLYRQSLLSPVLVQPEQRRPVTFTELSTPPTVIRCAVELHQACVSFKKSETKFLDDVHFNSKTGEFYLPFLMVNDDTECSFLNIMAFEHSLAVVSRDVTSYVCIMVELIDSAKDVSLLVNKGIISNSLGSDVAVASLFNSITKVAPDRRLLKVRRDVTEYCKKKRTRWRAKRNRWRANLIQTYFNNPWSALSLAGALLLLGLTIIQTVYAIIHQ